MAVPQYLIDNRENILNYNQNYNGWFVGYQNYREQYTIIENVYNQFNNNENPLSRQAIKNLYANAINDEELFFAFICSMVWGRRGLVGDGGVIKHFNYYVQHQVDIVVNLKQSFNYFSQNDITGSFKKLKEIRFSGVSYITKILYFAGYNEDYLIKPIIFDTIQARNYCKLLSLVKANLKRERMFPNPDNIIYTNLNQQCYLDYLVDMNYWANSLEVECDRLEAWIFDNNAAILELNIPN
jgi:hypothetical protein